MPLVEPEEFIRNSGEQMMKLINKTNNDFQAKKAAEAVAAEAENATENRAGSTIYNGWGEGDKSVTNEDDAKNFTNGDDPDSGVHDDKIPELKLDEDSNWSKLNESQDLEKDTKSDHAAASDDVDKQDDAASDDTAVGQKLKVFFKPFLPMSVASTSAQEKLLLNADHESEDVVTALLRQLQAKTRDMKLALEKNLVDTNELLLLQDQFLNTQSELGMAISCAGHAVSHSNIEGSKPGNWMPFAIRSLYPFVPLQLDKTPLAINEMQTFSHSFLVKALGGEDWCNGIHFPAPTIKANKFYLTDATLEPFLPQEPGRHGAKLAVIFREAKTNKEMDWADVPLFVTTAREAKEGRKKEYLYFGNYSQFRWSDKLDYDRMQEIVPEHVRRHWARLLASADRPSWMTKALRDHFWPHAAQSLDGIVASGGSSSSRISPSVKLNDMLVKDMYDAFRKADGAVPPGLRFWWEYLQCTGFDRNFYYMLCTEHKAAAKGSVNGAWA